MLAVSIDSPLMFVDILNAFEIQFGNPVVLTFARDLMAMVKMLTNKHDFGRQILCKYNRYPVYKYPH